MSSNKFANDVFVAYRTISFSVIADERGVKTANDKIQKEQEQIEAEPDGA
jgi:hypothetical protein